MANSLTIDASARDVAAGFDYAALPENMAAQARAAAHRIQRRNHKMVESIIENGGDLLSMKERLEHGQFEKWVATECAISERSARNYMAAARAFKGKTAMVADLSPTTIYALTASEAVRSQVIEKRSTGETLDERAIGDMLWQNRQDDKMAKAGAKLTPEQRKRQKARAERDRREWEQSRQKHAEDEAARKAALDEAAALIIARIPNDALRLVELLDVARQTEMSWALKRALGQ